MQIPDNAYQFAKWLRAEMASNGDAFLYAFWTFLYEKQKESTRGSVIIVGRDLYAGRDVVGGDINKDKERNE